MRTSTFAGTTVAVLLLAGCTGAEPTIGVSDSTISTADAAATLPTIVVHRTEFCGCCGEYETYLADHGIEVEVVLHDDVAPVKDGFGVPRDERSCHTNEVAGYAVEGHVPIEAIAALLETAPDIGGIALAGMPAGSPGMPGEQDAPFVVTMFEDGDVVGELGRF